MNTAPDFTKRCYKCDNIVRMTPEEFRASPNEFTCCERCKVTLNTEARFAGEPIPEKSTD